MSNSTQYNGNGIINNESLQTTALSDYALSKLDSGLIKIDVDEVTIGDGTVTLYQKVKAGKWILKYASFELTEVPDSSATTLTLDVTDGTNSALSAVVTFTEGTDSVGDILDGAIVTTANRVFTENEAVKLTVAGTSATLGKAKGVLIFLELQ